MSQDPTPRSLPIAESDVAFPRLDEEQIARQGRRLGLSLVRAREVILADIECRLFDGVRTLDGVARVGVELVTGTGAAHTPEVTQ